MIYYDYTYLGINTLRANLIIGYISDGDAINVVETSGAWTIEENITLVAPDGAILQEPTSTPPSVTGRAGIPIAPDTQGGPIPPPTRLPGALCSSRDSPSVESSDPQRGCNQQSFGRSPVGGTPALTIRRGRAPKTT